jgi:hypothetical protein
MNLSQIYLGWRNNLFPPEALKELIQTTSLERLAICEECSFHSKFHNTPLRPDNHCTDCGCNLDAKTKCLSCECPQIKTLTNRWGALMSLKEEQEILKTITNEKKQKGEVSKNSSKGADRDIA